MKRATILTAALAFLVGVGLVGMTATTLAQEANPPVQHGPGFVDQNGDGYNDRAPDHDGDGIPNGMDPDYTGPKMRAGRGAAGFIDENGDGVNDWAQDFDGDGIINRLDPDYNGSRAGRMGAGRHGGQRRFVDLDGDGINDWSQDFDGDGIINCQDPDWQGPLGMGPRGGRGQNAKGHGMSRRFGRTHGGRWGSRAGLGVQGPVQERAGNYGKQVPVK